MKSKLLSVYTDASGDDSKGTIAFSVWYRGNCLGRFTSVLDDYDCGNSGVLELIAIRTALIWVSENYSETKIKLVTDSDTAVRYINHNHLDKEPYRSIADEIVNMHLIEHLECIKSHTHSKRPDYLRNADVDMLAREAREDNCSTNSLISHSTDVRLYKQRELDDDTDLLKPVDAKKLVKRYYVEKETLTETVHTARTAIVSNIKSDMTQMEKYAARFKMFKK